MANTYTYSGPGTRWAVGNPTAVDLMNVARVNCDHLHEAVNTITNSANADGSVAFSGNLTVDTTTLFVDATANEVGIGTATPSSQLSLYRNNSSPESILVQNAGGGASMRFEYITLQAWALGIDGTDAFFKISEASDFSSNNHFVIDTSGRVGIGTEAPDGPGPNLHIQTSEISGLTADSNGQNLIVEDNGDAGISILGSDTSGSMLVFGSGSDSKGAAIGWVYDSANTEPEDWDKMLSIGTWNSGAQIKIQTGNGAEAVRIDSDGNVGINHNDPGEKLTIKANGTASQEVIKIKNSENTTKVVLGTDNSANGQINFFGAGVLQTQGSTNQLFLDTDGKVGIGTGTPTISRFHASTGTSGDWAIRGTTTNTDRGVLLLENTNASFGDNMIVATATRDSTNAFDLMRLNSNAGSDIEFLFEGNGTAYADGSWETTGGDYQELFESSTGAALEVGVTVVMDGNKVRASTSDDSADDIMGVVRPKSDNKNSAVVGNTAWNSWTDKYLTDDYGVYLREDIDVWTYTEEGDEKAVYARDQAADWVPPVGAVKSTESVRKLNPEYNKSQSYQRRKDRAEWNLIGLLGQIQIKKGEKVNSRWIKMKDISGTVELWYCR